jgi:hypothetical protein
MANSSEFDVEANAAANSRPVALVLRSLGFDNRHVGRLVTQNVALTLIDVTAREMKMEPITHSLTMPQPDRRSEVTTPVAQFVFKRSLKPTRERRRLAPATVGRASFSSCHRALLPARQRVHPSAQ